MNHQEVIVVDGITALASSEESNSSDHEVIVIDGRGVLVTSYTDVDTDTDTDAEEAAMRQRSHSAPTTLPGSVHSDE